MTDHEILRELCDAKVQIHAAEGPEQLAESALRLHRAWCDALDWLGMELPLSDAIEAMATQPAIAGTDALAPRQ